MPILHLKFRKTMPQWQGSWWKIEISKNKLLVWFSYLLSMQNSTSMSWDYDYLYGIPSLQLWREQRSNHCMCSRLGMLFTQNTEREREKKSLPSLRNLMNSHLQLSLTQQVNDFTTLRIRKLNLFSVILHW